MVELSNDSFRALHFLREQRRWYHLAHREMTASLPEGGMIYYDIDLRAFGAGRWTMAMAVIAIGIGIRDRNLKSEFV